MPDYSNEGWSIAITDVLEDGPSPSLLPELTTGLIFRHLWLPYYSLKADNLPANFLRPRRPSQQVVADRASHHYKALQLRNP